MKEYETPVNFFEPDYEKFPLMKNAVILEAKLEAGDCIYIPAFYYIQSETVVGESKFVTSEYAAHSQIVDMVMNSLDTITDDQSHSNDAKMINYLNNYF